MTLKLNFAKKKCTKCRKTCRKIYRYKSNFLCHLCYARSLVMIPRGGNNNLTSLENALKKVYNVRGIINSRNTVVATTTFPGILVGHKIKIVLADK